MDVQRIDGIKYNLDRLSDDELEAIHGNLLRQHARVVGEISLIEFKLFQRRNNPLPFDENGAAMDPYEMNSYGEMADPAIWTKYLEATRDLDS